MFLKSRHRKRFEFEKSVLGKPKIIGKESVKIVPEKCILCEKIKTWDHLFSTEQAVVKKGGTGFLRPSSNEKKTKQK